MTSRLTLPSEFFDITSGMMLTAPVPEFAFAKMLFAADARAQLTKADAASFFASMQRGPRVGGGADTPDLADMQLVLAKSIASNAISAVPELGKRGVGHTVRVNRPVFSGGGYTRAQRRIAPSASISTTPINVSQEQTSITIEMSGGPWDTANSRIAPYAISRVDSGRSVHELSAIVGMHLAYDRWKYVDSVVAELFDSGTTNVVRPAGISSDAGFPASGEVPFDMETLLRAEKALKSANVPRFPDGTYLAVLSAQQMLQLRLDPLFSRQSVFLQDQNVLQNSSVIRVGQSISIIEATTVRTDTTTVSGQTIQRGVMFGPGAVGYGLDEACRVASSNDDNYGEQAKVIWVAYEGFQVLDERFLCSMRSC